jgi:hypothetical protein
MAATLLQPVTSQQLDTDLANMADNVIALGTVLGQLANWAMNILIEDNRAADMLVDPSVYAGGLPTPMSQADVDRYRTYFGQLQYVCDLLMKSQGSSPAAADLVLPWARARVPMPPQPMPTPPGQAPQAMMPYAQGAVR